MCIKMNTFYFSEKWVKYYKSKRIEKIGKNKFKAGKKLWILKTVKRQQREEQKRKNDELHFVKMNFIIFYTEHPDTDPAVKRITT